MTNPTDEEIARAICECSMERPDDVYNPGDCHVGKWPTHKNWEQQIRWGHVRLMRDLFEEQSVCDCENPEPKTGVSLVSEDCPIHGCADGWLPDGSWKP